jgi:hypothetical protein
VNVDTGVIEGLAEQLAALDARVTAMGRADAILRRAMMPAAVAAGARRVGKRAAPRDRHGLYGIDGGRR